MPTSVHLRLVLLFNEWRYQIMDFVIQCNTEEVIDMVLSIRFTDEEVNVLKKFAALEGISVSELIRSSVFEKIEDVLDLGLVEEGIKQYQKDKKTYSLSEVKKLLK
jgi:RHH-type transcriptional regulator, rel operon repressor / antitoxin RelB